MAAMACAAGDLGAGGADLDHTLVDCACQLVHCPGGCFFRFGVIRAKQPRFAVGIEVLGVFGVAGVALHTERAIPLRHDFAELLTGRILG